MPIKVKLSREVMERRLFALTPKAEAAMGAAIEIGAKELAAAIQERAPVGPTGEYRNSIMAVPLVGYNGKKKRSISNNTITKSKSAWGIVADWYWLFLEYGTRPHTIKAKKKPRLVFEKDGQKVVAKQVNHPGTDAHPHIFNTYVSMRKRIRSRVARAVNKALKNR